MILRGHEVGGEQLHEELRVLLLPRLRGPLRGLRVVDKREVFEAGGPVRVQACNGGTAFARLKRRGLKEGMLACCVGIFWCR